MSFSIRSKFLIVVLLSVFSITAVHGQVINAQNMAGLKSQIELSGTASVIVEYANAVSSALSMHNLGEDSLRTTISVSNQRFEASLSTHAKAGLEHRYAYVPAAVLRVDAEMLEELESNPMVKGVYPNKMLKATLAESVDLVFKRHKSSSYDGSDWAVAVLDTGVDKNHTFLKTGSTQKVVSEACYSGGGFAPNPQVDRLCPGDVVASTANNSALYCSGYDGCAHGTHVAGIAAGTGVEFDGVAAGGNLIAIQVFTGLNDIYGFGDEFPCGGDYSCIVAYDADIIKGLERVYALRNTYKIAAVNMSLGGGGYSGSCAGAQPAMTSIINLLKQANIATVVASGNDGYYNAISFPACIPNAIAVGATTDYSDFYTSVDEVAYYSNGSSQLDLYAPGSLIRSSVPGSGYDDYHGTSAAAPHVAGAFAVIRQAVPNATVDQILTVLKSVGPNVIDSLSGISRHRLDVRAALIELGVSEANIAPILQLLLLDDD